MCPQGKRAAHADLSLAMCTAKHSFMLSPRYKWVKAYLDNKLCWEDLTITTLSLSSLRTVDQGSHHKMQSARSQLLSGETAAVIVCKTKQQKVGGWTLFSGRQVLTQPHGGGKILGWSRSTFGKIDWSQRVRCITPGIWLAKKLFGFCGTHSMVICWDPTCNGKCPNCRLVNRLDLESKSKSQIFCKLNCKLSRVQFF